MSMTTELTVLTSFGMASPTLVVETEMSTGLRGAPGISPYEEWLEQGNTGSYTDFLTSIANLSTGALWAQADW